jgi:hypothetical protein
MRSIITVIDKVLSLLTPVTPPDGSNENLTNAVAAIKGVKKQAMYYPPEADQILWTQLGQALYRYLPPPTVSPFSDISNVVTGSPVASVSAKEGK